LFIKPVNSPLLDLILIPLFATHSVGKPVNDVKDQKVVLTVKK
jgi:hypothetical protein